jgi:hypothetical protein
MKIISDFEEKCKHDGANTIRNYLETVKSQIKAKFQELRTNKSKFHQWDSNQFSQ